MVLQMADTTAMLVAPMFVHVGAYPLYDVEARLVNVDEHRRLIEAKNPLAVNALSGTMLRVGSMTPGLARGPVATLQHPSGRTISFNVFFSGRNGAWVQQFPQRWVVDGWATANKVIGLGSTKELLLEVSPNYPRGPEGEVDWEERPPPAVPQKQP
jgi:hypothetical protein